MATVYPAGCNTPAERTEFLYACQEILRHVHNLMSYWLHNDITQAQYNNPPLPEVPAALRSRVRAGFAKLKTKYPFNVRLLESEFQQFVNEDFEPRQNRISEQIGIQRAELRSSVTYDVDVDDM